MDPAIVVASISGVVAAASAVLAYRSSGRATDVNEQAAQLHWVKEIRQEAADTKRELEECKGQVRDLSRQLTVVTREADHWIAQYQLVHRTAWRPGVTLAQIRDILGPELPQSNGRSAP